MKSTLHFICVQCFSGLLLLLWTRCILCFFLLLKSHIRSFLCVCFAHLTINAFPFFLFAKFCCVKSCASLIYTCIKSISSVFCEFVCQELKSILCATFTVYMGMNVKCIFVGVDSCINEQNNFLIEAKENEQWNIQSKWMTHKHTPIQRQRQKKLRTQKANSKNSKA